MKRYEIFATRCCDFVYYRVGRCSDRTDILLGRGRDRNIWVGFCLCKWTETEYIKFVPRNLEMGSI